jgi:predicted permease
MIYALVKNGVVINIIVLNNIHLILTILEGYDYLIPINNSAGSPCIGWTFNGKSFSPPLD